MFSISVQTLHFSVASGPTPALGRVTFWEKETLPKVFWQGLSPAGSSAAIIQIKPSTWAMGIHSCKDGIVKNGL